MDPILRETSREGCRKLRNSRTGPELDALRGTMRASMTAAQHRFASSHACRHFGAVEPAVTSGAVFLYGAEPHCTVRWLVGADGVVLESARFWLSPARARS